MVVCVGVLAPVGVSAQGEGSPYADVSVDAWYYDYVEGLEADGVFEGTDCEEGFCPEGVLPRWQMAVWLIRVLEDGEPPHAASRFADVADDVWWMPYVERMATRQITLGCASGSEPKFCPERSVTRAQMASFLKRAFNLPPAPIADFVDVRLNINVINHAYNINRLYATGITAGCSTEPLMFCPEKSVTRAQMAAFLSRGLEWREANTEPEEVPEPDEEPPDEEEEVPEPEGDTSPEPGNPGPWFTVCDPDVFCTAENDTSRFFKHEIIDRYGDKWPWLKEVWEYTNRPDFEYVGDTGDASHVKPKTRSPKEARDIFSRVDVILLRFTPRYQHIANFIAIHELAHVYTIAHYAGSKPAPMAAAWLYFEQLADNYKCIPPELYAETAEYTDADFVSSRTLGAESYWEDCAHLPDVPTAEAITVVRQAFSGEMPDWFDATFRTADGQIDYEALWTIVKNSGNQIKRIVVRMLRDSFGGYCSEQDVWNTLFSYNADNWPQLTQPWRDGGCPPPNN